MQVVLHDDYSTPYVRYAAVAWVRLPDKAITGHQTSVVLWLSIEEREEEQGDGENEEDDEVGRLRTRGSRRSARSRRQRLSMSTSDDALTGTRLGSHKLQNTFLSSKKSVPKAESIFWPSLVIAHLNRTPLHQFSTQDAARNRTNVPLARDGRRHRLYGWDGARKRGAVPSRHASGKMHERDGDGRPSTAVDGFPALTEGFRGEIVSNLTKFSL
ncbi:hypothetical protein C8F04DRAFT_1188754 [Mycena alexandri]|uniref:Uncharacterized protein n=1 Tax=Mycena alexandri TaxID=1745969 RepID=A0AAD6SM82_9AGAR|nr:hypothetical protein C8F04DRAFT_1188754 [Mycena alexandri]